MNDPLQPTGPVEAVSRRWTRTFKPRGWSWWLVILGTGLFVSLGVWQITRGEQKASLLAERAAARHMAPRAIRSLGDAELPDAAHAIKVYARGHYVTDRQLLLEGMPYGNRSGYDVLTPFALEDGAIVLVNRGWIPRRSEFGGGYSTNLAVAGNTREIVGLWRALPAPGMRLATDNCSTRDWPRYVSYPTDADLRCLYGATIRRGEIELDPTEPDGFMRDWSAVIGFPPARHYAYAVQWFMFAVIAIYLFYRLNLRWVEIPSDTDAEHSHT